jgi:hypothetical protein
VQKCLAWLLIVFIVSGLSDRAAHASTDHSKQLSKLKIQLDNLPPDTVFTVKLKDHSEIEGKLVARAEEGFILATPEPTNVSYSEVKSITEDPNGQANPGSSQNSSRHHGHFLRNALIGVAVMCVLVVVIAVAAKK